MVSTSKTPFNLGTSFRIDEEHPSLDDVSIFEVTTVVPMPTPTPRGIGTTNRKGQMIHLITDSAKSPTKKGLKLRQKKIGNKTPRYGTQPNSIISFSFGR